MRRTLHILIAGLLLGNVAAGCDEPEVDEFRRAGGAAPDPTGVIDGRVLYVGPRPQCTYDDRGRPVGPIGRVILTLFEYDNPPPPAGSATSAENLLTIPGAELFTDLNDCLPEGAEPDPEAPPIMRSVAFLWPEIELAEDEARTFQIRGFYDYDADFNPFFSVTNQPTRGDVAGGAFIDISASPPQFLPIVFPSAHEAPQGAINRQPTVTLGAVVSTTRPVFELHPETKPLSAEQAIPVDADLAEQERMIYALTEMRLRMFGGASSTSRMLTPEQVAAFEAAGLDFDLLDEQAYAWYLEALDVNGDGEVDLHPILGRVRTVPWLSPVVLLRRIKSPVEAAAGVPDALIIPSARLSQYLLGQKTHFPNAQIVVVPVAAVVLNPEIPYCRVPYLAPGQTAATYNDMTESSIPTSCHELPTGNYAVIALHGFANAQFVANPLSPTGFNLSGAWSFTGQAWTVPNELGDPNQLGNPDAVLPSQSITGTFLVYDPRPANGTRGEPGECDTDPMGAPIDPLPVPEECCAPIAHLCGMPLCEPVSAMVGVGAAGQSIRTGQDTDGDGNLDCLPFLMPPTCCP